MARQWGAFGRIPDYKDSGRFLNDRNAQLSGANFGYGAPVKESITITDVGDGPIRLIVV